MQTEEQVNEFREALLYTLVSRQHWTSDYTHLSREFELLMELGAHGLLSLHAQHAIAHTLPDYYDSHSDEPDMAGPARARRGSDLPDLTWSAFKLLRKTHTKATFQVFSSYLPFGWLHQESGTFVTAGNTELNRLLPFISENDVVRLGVLAYSPATEPAANERKKYERHERAQEKSTVMRNSSPSLWMNWMVLEPRALQELQRIFRRW